jgi:hypothetical protein
MDLCYFIPDVTKEHINCGPMSEVFVHSMAEANPDAIFFYVIESTDI